MSIMKMNRFIFIGFMIFIFCGCNLLLDRSNAIVTLKPSANHISISEDLTTDFYFTATLATETPLSSTRYKLEYKEKVNGDYIPELSVEQDIKGFINFNKIGEYHDLKGISYASGDVINYMKKKNLEFIYVDITFYFEDEYGTAYSISSPSIELSTKF